MSVQGQPGEQGRNLPLVVRAGIHGAPFFPRATVSPRRPRCPSMIEGGFAHSGDALLVAIRPSPWTVPSAKQPSRRARVGT